MRRMLVVHLGGGGGLGSLLGGLGGLLLLGSLVHQDAADLGDTDETEEEVDGSEAGSSQYGYHGAVDGASALSQRDVLGKG